MFDLLRIFQLMWRAERRAFLQGLALSVAVLVAGLALLGLSGWFIVAASAAGLAGTGAVFDVFRPSAGVRFLALGRTAARYGERMLTHDATLRALARLRGILLRGVAQQPFASLSRMRASAALNRILADVDALDGLAIRLIFPAGAGLVSLAFATLIIGWLADSRLALWIGLGVLVPSVAVFAVLGRQSFGPSQQMAQLNRALRTNVIEHLRGRSVLVFAGALGRSRADIRDTSREAGQAAQALARLEFRAAAVLSIVLTLVATGALWLGALLVASGAITPALAAMSFFIVLAVGELLAPLQRGISEIGKMRDAAARVAPMLLTTPDCVSVDVAPRLANGSILDVQGLTIASPSGTPLIVAISFAVNAGETVALTGPSGCGKSSLLDAIAGLSKADAGTILIGRDDIMTLPDPVLRSRVGYLTQRPSLIGMTIAETLRLGQPEASDADIWRVLDAVALAQMVEKRGGLETRLTEAGANLSGGEARRMALARVLIRRPRLLLLDEPTEGLDEQTATLVLSGIRTYLPDTGFLMAAHRTLELAVADRIIAF